MLILPVLKSKNRMTHQEENRALLLNFWKMPMFQLPRKLDVIQPSNSYEICISIQDLVTLQPQFVFSAMPNEVDERELKKGGCD